MQGGSSALRNPNTNPKNPNGSISFKDALKGKIVTQVDRPQNMTVAYIVEKMDKVPTMDVKTPEVKAYFVDLQSMALICRFNGFWLKPEDLYKWVYSS